MSARTPIHGSRIPARAVGRGWLRTGLTLMLAAIGFASCVDQALDPAYRIERDTALAGAVPMPPVMRARLEGRYRVEGAVARFGDTVVVKWGGGYLSMYCGNTSYAYMQGGFLGDSCMVIGYWRNALTLIGGQVQLRIGDPATRAQLLDSTAPVPPGLVLNGTVGENVTSSTQHFTLRYLGPLPRPTRPFLILGHRAGGRNSDYHPVSENTPGMARFSERLGANGVEIDIRMTRDGVPIIFHDDNVSTRLIQQGSLIGPVSNYTFEQLRAFARLVRGEPLPTLREMLDTVLEATDHQFVYLDVKTPDVVAAIAPIQDEYMARAAARGRALEIRIGIPNEDVMNAFLALPDFRSRPSLNELSVDDLRRTNSGMWSPRWTQGILTADIAAVHSEGRRAIVWTLDDPKFIHEYITMGEFDGILTNYPAMVAYEYYMYGAK